MQPCATCGKPFEPRDARQKCCSKACGVKRYNQSPERRELSRANQKKHHEEYRAAANLKYDLDPERRDKAKKYAANRPREKRDLVPAEKAAARARPENRAHAARKTREWREEHPEQAARLD